MDEETKLNKYFNILYAINCITNDLIISGGMAQYVHLGYQNRKITDMDIILYDNFDLVSNIYMINKILGEEYLISSFAEYSTGGYRLKLQNTNYQRNKEIKTYYPIDVKFQKELYDKRKNLRILKYEQLLSNKLATTLIGDNDSHYLRVKDMYDLTFLLNFKKYDFDLVSDLLSYRLKRNDINNIFDTFLFKEDSEEKYLDYFDHAKGKYGLHDCIDIFEVKEYFYKNGDAINKRIREI